MSEVIVVTSGKGGVGKTTITANLSIALSKLGKKVIAIDTDIGLRNLDVVMGLENHIIYNIVDVIEGNCRLHQAIIKDRKHSNLYLLPSAQSKDKDAINPNQMVNLVEKLKTQYDYILIDCMPSLGMMVINALYASDSVLIPVQPQYYATDGLTELLKAVKGIKQRYNPKLEIEGILFTMDSRRFNNSKRQKKAVKEAYGTDVRIFEQSIPRTEALSETTPEGVSIFAYDICSIGAKSYAELAQEVLHHA